MKLCAIYVVWFDGIEILPYSIKSIRMQVDEVIVIYSLKSNYGQVVDCMKELDALNVTLVNWEPNTGKRPVINETEKRNFGLKIARSFGYTHFIMMDCDECYDPVEFAHGKELAANCWGLVVPVKVYLKKPTYQLPDHTLVPFIHELRHDLEFGSFRNYPFAYDGKHAHIDPTRRLSISSRVEMAPITMHHFSHIRLNMINKINNSTAKINIEKSPLIKDYISAKPGYYSEFYRAYVKEVENKFNIPSLIDLDILKIKI